MPFFYPIGAGAVYKPFSGVKKNKPDLMRSPETRTPPPRNSVQKKSAGFLKLFKKSEKAKPALEKARNDHWLEIDKCPWKIAKDAFDDNYITKPLKECRAEYLRRVQELAGDNFDPVADRRSLWRAERLIDHLLDSLEGMLNRQSTDLVNMMVLSTKDPRYAAFDITAYHTRAVNMIQNRLNDFSVMAAGEAVRTYMSDELNIGKSDRFYKLLLVALEKPLSPSLLQDHPAEVVHSDQSRKPSL